MRIVQQDEIRTVLNSKNVIDAVCTAFIDQSLGHIQMPPPVQMVFGKGGETIAGDCHVKTAYSDSYPYFCIKVATGFYQNPAKGLNVNNGLVLLLSTETGEPLALFQDGGLMTSARTAAAGALAASLAGGASPHRLGIIGTGHQAEMQSRWISAHKDISTITLYGRSETKVRNLKKKLSNLDVEVTIASTISECAEQSDIIVTTTPATSPILLSEHIRAGHHIVALGADSPGKTELDPNILARADLIVTDDHEQCLAHGEFGHAVRAGQVAANADTSFGSLLADSTRAARTGSSLSVVDLTGLGAQDLAIASLIYSSLQ